MEDTAIIRLFQERSQQAIAELSQKSLSEPVPPDLK